MRRVFLLLTLLPLLATTVVAQDLIILHTNDTHSQMEPFTSGRNSGFGGVERRSTYINSVRATGAEVLLLDAGDYNQGTPYYTLFKGMMEVELFNAMGYDAVALGNHEFDDGQEDLARRLKSANYPVLCANYNFDGTPLEGLVKPYTIVERAGKKIGIIGLLIDLKGYVDPKGIVGLKYEDPIKVGNRLAKELKVKEGVDMVIYLTHVGVNGRGKRNPGDIDLAKKSRDVDLIIGGHSHTYLEQPLKVKNRAGKEVLITQTGSHGVNVGRIEITF